MSNLEIMWNTKNINTYVNFIRRVLIIMCTYYVFIKAINVKLKDIKVSDKILIIISMPIISFITCSIKSEVKHYRIFVELFLISVINYLVYKNMCGVNNSVI